MKSKGSRNILVKELFIKRHLGIVYGLIIDGEIIHRGSFNYIVMKLGKLNKLT